MSLPVDQEVVALTVKGFRRVYGVGHTKVYELINRGQIRIAKAGRRTLIDAESARQWWESIQKPAPAPSPAHISGADFHEQQRTTAELVEKRRYQRSSKHRRLRKTANGSGG
jgi:excisionase family DNA binding protein